MGATFLLAAAVALAGAIVALVWLPAWPGDRGNGVPPPADIETGDQNDVEKPSSSVLVG